MDPLKYFIRSALPVYNLPQDPILISSMDGKIQFVNPAYTNFTGFGAEFITGHMLQEFELGANIKYSDILFDLGKGETGERKISFRGAKGNQLVCTIVYTLIKDKHLQPIGILFIFYSEGENDPNLMDAFKGDVNLLKALNTRSSEILILSLMTHNKFLFCSDSYEKITGWKSEEYIKGGWARSVAYIHPDDVAPMADAFISNMRKYYEEPYVHDNEPIIIEYRIRHKNGQWIWIQSEVLILDRDEIGNIRHLIAFLRDNSENKSGKGDFILDPRLEKLLRHGFNADATSSRALSEDSSETTHHYHLSERERELVLMIRKGLSSKEIADLLGLSLHTIHSYRKNLMAKLNARNSAELVRISIEQNLL